jgi:hypothetical protein
VPLELAAPHRQRRDQERRHGDHLWLAIAYAGVALLEQGLKLALNLYRAWVSEDAVRGLRRPWRTAERASRDAAGTHTAMAVAEAEPIGGFVGHGDLRAAAADRHPGERRGLHGLSRTLDAVAERRLPDPAGAVRAADAARHQPARREAHPGAAPGRRRYHGKRRAGGRPHRARVTLNNGHLQVQVQHEPADELHALPSPWAVALGVGGWFAIQHRIDVGTVVAVVSGLGKLKDPWSDLVNWGAASCPVDSVKYRLFADALGRRGLATA